MQLDCAAAGGGMADAASEYGPLQNRVQYEKVCAYIEDIGQHGTIIAFAGGDIERVAGLQAAGLYIGHGDIGHGAPLAVVRDVYRRQGDQYHRDLFCAARLQVLQ